MSEPIDFPWPPLGEGEPPPRWDGATFLVGDRRLPVLEYSRNEAAWDAALTEFHEETATADHPIDVASRNAALGALSRFAPGARTILEIGSSSGFLLPMLCQAFPHALVVGSDAFPQALRRLAARGIGTPLVQFDITRCPLPDACLDAIVALNVLEHIDDDGRALAELKRILKPGGIAYIEVPAGPRLYDVYDRMLRHHRRYGRGELVRKASRAGFDIPWSSHLGCFVFPAFALVKRRNRRLLSAAPEEQRAEVARRITASRASASLALALRLEGWLGRIVRFPFGVRSVSVLRRPSQRAVAGRRDSGLR
jgi:SAM-dependent methyltransferase